MPQPRLVVRGTARIEALQKPGAKLGARQRHPDARAAAWNRREGRRRRARSGPLRIDAPGHAGNRPGVGEQRVQRQLDAERGAHLRQELRAAQRVAAEHEEVGPSRHRRQAQDARPQRGQRHFGRRQGCARLGGLRFGRRRRVVADPRRQVAAADLAAVGARQLRDEPESTRGAVGTERVARPLQERRFVPVEPGLQHDCGDHLLAQARVRNRKRGGVDDAGKRAQHRVDLRGRDLVAAAVDLLLDATGEMELAGVVEVPEVAHPEPAVDEARGIELRIVVVAVEHLRPAHLDLADLARRDDAPRLVDQPDLAVDQRPDRAAYAPRRRQPLLRERSPSLDARPVITGTPSRCSSSSISAGSRRPDATRT